MLKGVAGQRLEVSVALTKSDFAKYRVNEVLARRDDEAAGGLSAFSYWSVCGEERRRLEEAGDDTGNELFGLLTDVSSMGFWDAGAKPEQPFSPMWTGLIPGKRSCLPEDLSESDLSFLAEIVHDVEESIVRARIADVLWLRKHGSRRGYDFAVLAHDSYLVSIGLCNPDFYTWNRLRRALEIAKLLSDSEKRKSALAVARELADALARTDKFALWIEIIKLLAGYSNEMHEGNKYAEQIWQRASEFEQKMGFNFSVRCMEDAISLFRQLGNKARADEAQLELAEMLLRYARQEADNGDYWGARLRIEEAIAHYKAVSGSDQHLENLFGLLAEYSKKAAENMNWKEEKIERSEEHQAYVDAQAETVAEALRDRQFDEALLLLANAPYPMDSDAIRKNAEERSSNSMTSLVSVRTMDHAGKTVSRDGLFTPGFFAELYRCEWAESLIHPAIVQLEKDHKDIEQQDIVKILEQRDFVPGHLVWTFSYGLLAGLKFDLVGVAHVLPPLLECAFREMLSAIDINTSRWDDNLVSQEKSLGRVLEHAAFEEILGADLLFDLKTLLLDWEGGFNLRNGVAHGLLTDGNFHFTENGKNGRQVAQVIYLWWLALRLCFIIKRTDRAEQPAP